MAAVTVDRTSQRFTSSTQPEPDVCVEHTTEVMAWPGYADGGQAPHATIWPLPGVGIKVREHIPWTQNAKALMNLPGGVETNRRGAIQFELVGTCDPKHKGDPKWFYWPDADDVVLEALADYQRPILAQFGIPLEAPPFQAYSASYGPRGATNTVRMSNAQWLAFQGICGHQHVPENVHGDPGAFPIDRFIAFLKGDDMPTAKEVADEILGRPVYDLAGNKLTVGKAIGITLRNSAVAATDARVSRALAEASAKADKPLTAAEIDDIAKAAAAATLDALDDDYTATVTLTPKETP